MQLRPSRFRVCRVRWAPEGVSLGDCRADYCYDGHVAYLISGTTQAAKGAAFRRPYLSLHLVPPGLILSMLLFPSLGIFDETDE